MDIDMLDLVVNERCSWPIVGLCTDIYPSSLL
jgi:hypothetical protein